MRRETKKNLIIALTVITVLVIICYQSYKPKKVVEFSDESKYEMNPRRMHLQHLQRESNVMGFGMGPGLVDSRRHHVIA